MVPGALTTAPNAAVPLRFRKSGNTNGDERFSGAGVMFVTPAGDALFIKRKGSDHAGEWAFPAGRVEQDEEPIDTARREAIEEVGSLPRWNMTGLHRETSEDGVDFSTFGQMIPQRFDPVLNDESEAYVWAPLTDPPEPLHPGVARMLKKFFEEEAAEPEHQSGSAEKVAKALDAPDLTMFKLATDAEWNESDHPRAQNGQFGSGGSGGSGEYGKWTQGELGPQHQVMRVKEGRAGNASEKEAAMLGHKPSIASPRPVQAPPKMPDHSQKKAISAEELQKKIQGMPIEKLRAAVNDKNVDPQVRALVSREITTRLLSGSADGMASDSVTLAMDRDSVRSFDQDGRMRVAVTNISKAIVNPYKGSEIPGYHEDTGKHDLGLDPDKIYRLLRDPEELRKSVPTWNGIQLLRKHEPVDVNDHKKYDIVGTTGTNAEFSAPYLRNSLVFWTKEGIDFVESGERRELSCGYHYDPDMTAGVYDGEPYDGIMRNIRGNHVAIVEEGRAGHDVVVADSIIAMQWAAIEGALSGAWPG